MQVLAIIPARGGSKGIPLKNIKKLASKPLIEYTISAAKKSKLVDKIIVSTDSKKIAKIAESRGAEIPFMRPKSISGDSVPQLDVVKHAVNFLGLKQSYYPDIIVLLQPTSPLRTSKVIDRSVRMLKNSKASSVVTVAKVKHHPYASFWYKEKYLKPFKKDFERQGTRQKRPALYAPTGSVYAFWYKTLKKFNSLYGPKIKPIIEDELAVDIDTYFDFFVNEMISKHWKKFKKKI